MNPNKLGQPDLDHSFTDHIKVVIDQKTIPIQKAFYMPLYMICP